MTLRPLLIWCSGASPELLKKCVESESIKQSIIGTFVLLTGLLAALTSFYTFFSISKSVIFALPTATLWGILIFTLDRLIVSSMRAVYRNNVYTLPVYQILPRILLSTLIGFTLGIPLELFIFGSEIREEINVTQETNNQSLRKDDLKYKTEAAKEIADRCDLKHRPEIKSLENSRDSYDQQIQSTIRGEDGTGKTCGPVCIDLTKKQQLIEEKLRAANAKRELCIATDERELRENTTTQQIEFDRQAKQKRQKENAESPSILTQYTILQKLGDHDFSIYRATIFIPLLLIFIEVVPVLAKTLAGISAYDLLAFQQRQEAIDLIEHAKLEGETMLARKKLFEFNNINLAEHEKSTVAELHRGVHDQVKEAFLQKVQERIELWCTTIADRADVEHLQDRFSALFCDRIQSISDSVSAGSHAEFKRYGTGKPLSHPMHSRQGEQAKAPPVDRSHLPNTSATEADTTAPTTRSTPPHIQQASGHHTTPPKASNTGDGFREYQASFLKKAVESLASKIPDLLVYLFSSSAAFIAGFPAVTLGLATSTGVSLMIIFPTVLVAFVVGRTVARNIQHTPTHSAS